VHPYVLLFKNTENNNNKMKRNKIFKDKSLFRQKTEI
jgi:hypothetical protein